MERLVEYMKIAPPDESDLRRAFLKAAPRQQVQRLEVDITLPPAAPEVNDRPGFARPSANQMKRLRGFMADQESAIFQAFRAANVITCDGATVAGDGATLGVWVRAEDAETAKSSLTQSPWVQTIRQSQPPHTIGDALHR